MFEREFEQGVMAFEFEFLADAGAVVFDGADAEAEFVGDLLARFIFGDQFQHAPFDGAERGDLWFPGGQLRGAATAVEQEAGELRADLLLPGGHCANALDGLGQGAVFDNVTFHVQIERAVEEVFVLVHGQKDDHHLQARFADGAGDFKTLPSRHIHIEDGDVNVGRGQLLPRRFAIFGFIHNDELRRAFNDLPQAVPEDRVVVIVTP